MKKVIVNKPGGLNNLSIIDADIPEPKDNEVLVKWHATSLNYHDYLVCTGAIPCDDGRVPMSDGAGEIVAVGNQVKQWQIGDQVMSMFFPNWTDGQPTYDKIRKISGESVDGYICEYSVLSPGAITAIPKDMSYAAAATLPCAALTAWNGLFETGRCRSGSTVLIQGTGGMSIAAAQLALSAGARVIATTSQQFKVEKLYELGCDAVYNYKEDERWGKTIFKDTGGIDLVLDVGGGSTMSQSIEAVAMGGQIISIGILGDGRKGNITFPKLFFKFVTLSGIAVGSRAMQHRVTQAIESNKIEPIVDKVFEFDELSNAFKYQASGAHFGKIVLEW